MCPTGVFLWVKAEDCLQATFLGLICWLGIPVVTANDIVENEPSDGREENPLDKDEGNDGKIMRLPYVCFLCHLVCVFNPMMVYYDRKSRIQSCSIHAVVLFR